jgi:MinD-like ATPase involved in chromosome partitioning or flagellar assembly
MPEELPPVVVFHSFKGGVGRTTHAIALALALLRSDQRVLLVDADLEAPGISWLLQQRLPEPPVAFADFLALVHGEPSSEAEEATELVADRLLDALVDGIYVLPAFRSPTAFASLEVRPEHLIRGAEDPYILTRVLAQLGKAVRADAVLVDLRAGLSELATGLLLDPRVYRILVTTLSGQAVAGTCLVLDLLGSEASSTRTEDPLPALVISQVTNDNRESDLLRAGESRLLEAAKPFLGESDDRDLPVVITPFDPRLLALPSTWEDIINRIQRSEIVDGIRPLVDWLPGKSRGATIVMEPDLRTKRQALRDIAKQMLYAESQQETDFLATTPLRHLASDHRNQVPIAVIVGAKGAGKTYTFLQLIHRQNWETFARDAGASETQVSALVFPVLESTNLQTSIQNEVREVRERTARELGLSNPPEISTIRDFIRGKLGPYFAVRTPPLQSRHEAR